MNTFEEHLVFHSWLLAAFVPYGVLAVAACFAPPKQKRFLFFIISAAAICLLASIPLEYFAPTPTLVALLLPAAVFLASFYQFFIKGIDAGIAATAIGMQILGMFFVLLHMAKLCQSWSVIVR